MPTPQQTMESMKNSLVHAHPQRVMSGNGVLNRDLFKWLPKQDGLDGEGKFLTVQTSTNRGSGSTYSQAKANVSSAGLDRFYLESNDFYLQDTVARKLMLATAGKGGIFKAKSKSIKDMTDNTTFDIEKACWGTGDGRLGVIGSLVLAGANTVITLTLKGDAMKVSKNDAIVAYNGAVARIDTISRVIAINRAAGTITMSGDKVALLWAAGDTLHMGTFGTIGGVGDDSKKIKQLQGLGIWIPETPDVAPALFLKQDRTGDVERLQGHRVDFNTSIELTLGDLHSNIAQLGGRPDGGWFSHIGWNQLKNELGTKVVLDPGVGRFGLKAIMFSTSDGEIPIMKGAMCPNEVGYLLKRDSWEIAHLGGLPHLMAEITSENFDGMVLGVSAFAELGCDSPRDNGRMPTS